MRDFLLKVLKEDQDGVEKFNDEILQEAANAFYWMAVRI
jgi:hypothetical protein